MPATPLYEGKKRSGSIILNDANGTSPSGSLMAGVSSGTRVREVRVCTTGAAPGTPKMEVILVDATNRTVVDIVTFNNVGNVVAGLLRYDNLFLVDTGCSLEVRMVTALPAGCYVHVEVFGADF